MNQRERHAALLMRAPHTWAHALAALLVPLLMVAALLFWHSQFLESEQLRSLVARSYDRRLEQTDLLSRLKDAETAQRGYLLTGDPAFLAPYEPARRAVDVALGAMDRIPDEDVPRAFKVRTRALAKAKFAELDETIAAARAGPRDQATAIVRTGRGRQIMDRLRAAIGATIDREARLVDARRAGFAAKRKQTELLVYAGAIGGSGLLLLGLLFLWWLQKQRYQALLDASEAAERNATILDSTIDAILILNPSGTVEIINASATQMLGYASHELERRDIATVIDLAPGEGSFHKRVGLIDGQLRQSFLPDRLVRHRDGHVISVDVAIGVMSVPSGDHLVVSLRDISERKRVERVKDDLISTVSHELRTPLTSVVGSLGLLRAGSVGALPDGAARLVEIAENNSRRLIRLINDMLDIDRIESGKLELTREPIDLRLVVDRACVGSEGLAASAGVRIDCRPPDRPAIVSGDVDRLLQVATNLLSNAIRAAPAGSIVEFGLSFDPAGRAMVTVDDRGPGIPKAFRDRIFGRFERAGHETGSTGTGLGLAISREIVARHDGAIWFEDRVGGGTRFAFALPMINAAAARDDAAPRILVCEQDETLVGTLVAMVATEGCACDVARDVAEARAAIATHDYEALLVDLNLPEDGGLAFARAARGGDRPFDGPIILLSSSARGDGEGISPLDVIDWIDKPGDTGRIATALRTALRRGGARRPVVLHLDDDRDLLDVVAAALEPEVRIVTATDMPAARELLQTTSPDAVILDIQLAQGTGLDLMPFLVDVDGLAIPTIVYSAQDVSADCATQVDAVLVKARGSIPDLKATVRRVMRTRETAG